MLNCLKSSGVVIAAVFCWLLLCPQAAEAHLGSSDVYFTGQAGPYGVDVTVRLPAVIPGVAQVEVRTSDADVKTNRITPIPMSGEAAQHPPTADSMQRSATDPHLFTGSLWIMAPGSWQVRMQIEGGKGNGLLAVPVPSVALSIRKMDTGLGILLAVIGAILLAGMVGIIAAAARESTVAPGGQPTPQQRRNGWRAAVITLAVLSAIVWFGNSWWKAEAANYARSVYKPLQLQATLESRQAQEGLLQVKLTDPGWMAAPQDDTTLRRLDDLLPDHGHFMHLFLVRKPGMDVFYHLHPTPVATGEFSLGLPEMPAGDYTVYADIVHGNGFPETVVGALTIPAGYFAVNPPHALAGDDTQAIASPMIRAPEKDPALQISSQHMADGYTMIFSRPHELVPRQLMEFKFSLLDSQGEPPKDMVLYMGMLGHAAFVKDDGTVFAHIHPSGTVAMAALELANPQAVSDKTLKNGMAAMPGMQMKSEGKMLANEVSFPYGLPSAGRYRLLVQMKHGSTVESAIWDLDAP
jgi:hypothetical protein